MVSRFWAHLTENLTRLVAADGEENQKTNVYARISLKLQQQHKNERKKRQNWWEQRWRGQQRGGNQKHNTKKIP
jgi:hypothetical protein